MMRKTHIIVWSIILLTAPLGFAQTPASNATPKSIPSAASPQAPQDLPLLPGTAAKAAVTNALTTVVPQLAEPDTTKYSYGEFDINSVMFTPAQIKSMKDALKAYESTRNKGIVKEELILPPPTAEEAPKIEEPASYPVFYLSSVVFDHPGDWSLWVSGHKITAKQNTTDLKVIAVTANSVSFAWSPTYMRAIQMRRSENQFAPTDSVKNRLVTPAAVRIDETMGVIYFTLRPNQSFAVGYFTIFEGLMPSPKLPALKGMPIEGEGEALEPLADPTKTPTDPSVPGWLGEAPPTRSEMDAMLKQHQETKMAAEAEAAAAAAANPAPDATLAPMTPPQSR